MSKKEPRRGIRFRVAVIEWAKSDGPRFQAHVIGDNNLQATGNTRAGALKALKGILRQRVKSREVLSTEYTTISVRPPRKEKAKACPTDSSTT